MAEWRFALIMNGGSCVTTNGVMKMHKLLADSWGFQLKVSSN